VGHFNALVTQGFTHVQPPAPPVHWPEFRKFGLGVMFADGFVILKVTTGVVVFVVVVVVGAGVVLVAVVFDGPLPEDVVVFVVVVVTFLAGAPDALGPGGGAAEAGGVEA